MSRISLHLTGLICLLGLVPHQPAAADVASQEVAEPDRRALDPVLRLVVVGEDARGAQVGHGAVEVRLRDLLRQASTMRGVGARGALAKGGAPIRFLASFASRMRRVYGSFLAFPADAAE